MLFSTSSESQFKFLLKKIKKCLYLVFNNASSKITFNTKYYEKQKNDIVTS